MVDHVHTCTTCLDDVECLDALLDCPRYLGLAGEAYQCRGCRADVAVLQQPGAVFVDQSLTALPGGRS